MGDLRYVLFNSISVISGRWAGDNERLCAMEPRLRLNKSPSQTGLEPESYRIMNFSLFQYTNCVILLHKVTLHDYDVVKFCRVKISLRCLRGNELGSP